MNLQSIGIKYRQGNVIFARETLLKPLEGLLTRAPECLELAVLYVAIRDGKTLEEVMAEIEAETEHLTQNEAMRKRLLEAIRSKEWLSWEDVKEKIAL
jgi:hypothetical protein